MKKVSNLYQKLLKFLIKKGKLNKARQILNKTFFSLYLIFNKPIFFLLNSFFLKLNVFIETRSIRIKRTRYLVPFVINLKRRIFLVLKWLFISLLQNKKRRPLFLKLSKEIFYVLKGLNCKTVDLQQLNTSKALLNRSNIHYRW
jgi:ribosomal protein S7